MSDTISLLFKDMQVQPFTDEIQILKRNDQNLGIYKTKKESTPAIIYDTAFGSFLRLKTQFKQLKRNVDRSVDYDSGQCNKKSQGEHQIRLYM